MWWFNKPRRNEPWDQEIQWPLGDIEAAHKIRDICDCAADSAEEVAGFADRPDENKNSKRQTARYERAAKAAMEIAIRMSDDLMRDAAVRRIVNLCMKANDLKTARILFRAVQAASIKQDIRDEHPILGQ